MASWDVSRHPEWDLMYKAGLTAREIADSCRQNVATVHRHLQLRDKYEPGFQRIHETALATRCPDRPTTRWRKRLQEVISLYETQQRLPRRDLSTNERSLYRWVAEQRRAFEKDTISKAKISLMSGLPDWTVNQRQRELDARWQENLLKLKTFVMEAGYFPRYKNYGSELEHFLGVWLHRHHQKRSEGTITPWKLDALNNAFAEWRSHM